MQVSSNHLTQQSLGLLLRGQNISTDFFKTAHRPGFVEVADEGFNASVFELWNLRCIRRIGVRVGLNRTWLAVKLCGKQPVIPNNPVADVAPGMKPNSREGKASLKSAGYSGPPTILSDAAPSHWSSRLAFQIAQISTLISQP